MKTKWEYYKENRYYVHNMVMFVMGICFIGLWIRNGFTWPTILGAFICFFALVVTYFKVTTSYRKWVEQEIDKTNWASTRTDMINTEEDD